MAQEKNTTIKMMYSGQLEYISCPAEAKYEDFIAIANERFPIPDEFKNFIQISNEFKHVFDKDTFDYFLLLFPNPEIIFYIRVDYKKLLCNLKVEARTPLVGLINKRKNRDEDIGVPVTRQNCFMGSLPGSDLSEEPKAKRSTPDFIRSRANVVQKSCSRTSIRI